MYHPCLAEPYFTVSHTIMQNPTDPAETPISMETDGGESPNLNRTFTVRRKVAKRSDRWYRAPSPPQQNIAVAMLPLPQAEDILEEPQGYKRWWSDRVRLQNAEACRRYRKTAKGKLSQKRDNFSRRKPRSRILKTSLNEILHNGMSIAKAEVLPLLLSPWDSRCGLSFHMDAPMCNHPLWNNDRPGVLRTSYGKDCHDSDEDDMDFVTRYVDGTGYGSSSVGTDPRSGQTKQMSLAMWELGVALQNQLQIPKNRFCKTMDLSEEFNSVSILLYIGSDVIKECTVSDLAYSSDIEFNTKGEFVKDNSQKENTPVVVLTLGDPRTVHMKKRKKGKDGNWMNNEREKTHDFLLTSGSIFVLDPADEELKERGRENQGLSQFHHRVKVTKGLSMAIMFRTVTTKAKIHVINNTKQLGEKEKEFLATLVHPCGTKRKSREEDYTDAYNDALKQKETMEDQFKKYVQTAKDDGTLFTGQET